MHFNIITSRITFSILARATVDLQLKLVVIEVKSDEEFLRFQDSKLYSRHSTDR